MGYESESGKFAEGSKQFAEHEGWAGVDQSVSLVERCRDLIAKQTVLPPSQPPSS